MERAAERHDVDAVPVPTAWPEMDGTHLGRGYVWPDDPLEVAWCGRFKDLDALRTFGASMQRGDLHDFIEAFVAHREGRADEAMVLARRLLEAADFDPLWTARLDLMHVTLLHGLGLTPQALEVTRRALVSARASGNPSAVLYALHMYGVCLERTDGPRTQQLYMQVVDLIDAVEGAPPHARDELEALRGVAAFNSHLFSDRTGLPLLPGTPGLVQTQDRLSDSWPPLSAAIQAFRGVSAFEAGDRESARAILEGLPDPGTLHDAPRSVIVATGATVHLMIEGRHEEGVALADALLESIPPEYVPEALIMKARIYEDLGDFEKAYRVAWDVIDAQGRSYGAEAREAMRALEVFYRTDEHREAADSARQAGEAIAEQAEEWLRASLRDPLTDAWNRRYLQRRFEELDGTTGHQLAVIDLDGFKAVNDRFGHAAGDAALVSVADAVRGVCRGADVVVRYGGDEFAVLRPAGVPHPLGDDLAAISRPVPMPGVPAGGLTVSIGVAEVGSDGFTAALARADAHMYEAKRRRDAAPV